MTAETDAAAGAEARALLGRMTREEKIAALSGDPEFWPGFVALFTAGYNTRPYTAGAVPRLGIEGIAFSDGPRGIALGNSTCFPVTMARGATWDVDLERRIGEAMGAEARAQGANLVGAVCINLLRHPAWGRAQETYGEDTHHLGAMGAALTEGLQRHVMACVKHYALNSMENARFKVDVAADPRTLHEIYLPHFKACIDAGAPCVMSAYNSVNGAWAGENRALLTGILKQRWGFDGFVISDWLFGVRDGALAIAAGQDVEMPFRWHVDNALPAALADGSVPVERLDDAVLRKLRAELRHRRTTPAPPPATIVASPEHRALAREAARKSIVLLRNEPVSGRPLLPLDTARIRRLAVLGRLADIENTGDHGSSRVRPPLVVTPLAGLRAAAEAAGIAILHSETDATIAADTDAAIVIVGYDYHDEGEFIGDMKDIATLLPPPPDPAMLDAVKARIADRGSNALARGGDRASLTLSAADEALIAAVAAVQENIIVAMIGGSAIITEAWHDRVPATLMLWYSGMEGGHALADILFGAVCPSGRLPFSIPRDPYDLPLFDIEATHATYDYWHGYRLLERNQRPARYPFGYGLSYTSFRHGDIAVDRAAIGPGETLRVTARIANTGEREGDEVAQVYIAAPGRVAPRAPKDLRGFARVSLRPGEEKEVTFLIRPADLAWFDPARDDWAVEPGEYRVILARDAADDHAKVARFTVSD